MSSGREINVCLEQRNPFEGVEDNEKKIFLLTIKPLFF